MTEGSQTYNLRTLRNLMIAAFDTEELLALISFDDTLSSLAAEFAPTHPITTMVDRTISWCERRGLIPYLVQLVKKERPEKVKPFEPELFITANEQPGEKEKAKRFPEILTIKSPFYLYLVRVPAGRFLMGSIKARDERAQDREFPAHRVYVPEFHIARYPVTNLQYEAFVKATGSQAPRHWKSGETPSGKENHPVVWVTWHMAYAFCAWLSEETRRSFRLPTEAEWEKAARGTDGRIYPWGDEPPDGSRCNFGQRVGHTTPIGRYSPDGDSPYGCVDMAGNVWEWCHSLRKPYPYEADDGREAVAEDMSSQDDYRVLRGGSFSKRASYLRCAYRGRYEPDGRSSRNGFRVAMGPLKGAP